MKRKWIILTAVALLAILPACEFAGITIDFGGNGNGGGSAPSLEAGVDSPVNDATLEMSATDITYHATSTDGISAVELSIDGQVVNSYKSPDAKQKVAALTFTWTPAVPGSHTIRVRAQSSTGAWSDFYAVTVNVQGQAPPAQPEPEADSETEQSPEPEEEENGVPDTDEVTIYDIKRNKDIFYYGPGGCNRELTISMKVANPEDVYVAVLFAKFIDKEGAGSTNWDSGRAMVKKSEGDYSVTLFSESIPNWSIYEFAKMWYQIVLQDKSGSRMTASEVIKDLDFQICQ